MRENAGAVVLAAGQGTRMHAKVAKQFLELKGKPLICYALEAFEKSRVSQVILVTGRGEVEYCKKEIVDAFGFSKVEAVVPGGEERYHSVYEGLKALGNSRRGEPDYVLIHDGARPLVSEEVIERALEGAVRYRACAVGMPVKDTIKISGQEGFASGTPDRRTLWQIQTPQAFSYRLVLEAYEEILKNPEKQKNITDDAMVIESVTSCPVKLVEGDYRNIKVTTPEDLLIANALLPESSPCPGEKRMKKE